MGSRFREEVGLRQLPIIHSPARDPIPRGGFCELGGESTERGREIPRSTRLHSESSKQLNDLDPPKLTLETTGDLYIYPLPLPRITSMVPMEP